jgi:hypothetical protein
MLRIKIVDRRRRVSMTYSWPGPVPPGARRGTVKLIRCARCGGSLFHTKAKGQPRQEDHEQGCQAFITAIRTMRYVDELKRCASASAGTWSRTRRWRSYVRDGAKELSLAACASDPEAALGALGDSYEAERRIPAKRLKAKEQAEMAEMMMRVCRQLAVGQQPEPIAPPQLAR